MITRQKTEPATATEKERELAGVLTAISIVSKRLARRLIALEKQGEGGAFREQDKRP